jgi:hypothetical protein
MLFAGLRPFHQRVNHHAMKTTVAPTDTTVFMGFLALIGHSYQKKPAGIRKNRSTIGGDGIDAAPQ